jgi:hypothetical protein
MNRFLAVLLGLLTVTGCGSDKPSGTDEGGTLDYLPLGIGVTWVYQVTEDGVIKQKTNLVEAYEDVGGPKAGVMAYRINTDKLSGTGLAWQKVTGKVLNRLREQEFAGGALTLETWYEPARLRVDTASEHTALGASWVETYTENAIDYTTSSAGTTLQPAPKTVGWQVVALEESVTVPAGTFSCLHVNRTNISGTGKVKEYWYALGIGKIKEISAGQTEELVSYSLP